MFDCAFLSRQTSFEPSPFFFFFKGKEKFIRHERLKSEIEYRLIEIHERALKWITGFSSAALLAKN